MTAGALEQTAIAAWEALGTSAVLLLEHPGPLAEARAIVERELDEVDRACSRFRPDSDLAAVNAHAGRAVRVSPLLIEAVQLALRAAEITDGIVTPTIGVALELAGYDRDWSELDQVADAQPGRPQGCVGDDPARAPRVRVSMRSGWRAIHVDRARSTIAIPAGVKLDLGATAKAWAADRASRAVNLATGYGVLVSLGGDISTAGPSPAGGWQVHVTDDHRAGCSAPGQRIAIHGGGLATSSTAVRRWRQAGREMHHIIDPSTGAPAASPWRTVSVAAIDCADANIVSTAALVRGEDAPDWLAELGVPARLVAHDGGVLEVGSWPREEVPT